MNQRNEIETPKLQDYIKEIYDLGKICKNITTWTSKQSSNNLGKNIKTLFPGYQHFKDPKDILQVALENQTIKDKMKNDSHEILEIFTIGFDTIRFDIKVKGLKKLQI